MNLKSIFQILLVFLVFMGCVSTARRIDTSKIESKSQLSPLDLKLWEQSDFEVGALRKSGLIYYDDDLDSYINFVGKNLIPDSINQSIFNINIHVIMDPGLNAFALPNGSIFVHLGLLVRAENESQLAMILAHEIVHVLKRHSVHRYSQINNTSGFMQLLSVATAIGFGAGGGAMAGFWNSLAQSGLQLTAMASVSGFGRVAETEADMVALDYMEAKNYNLHEGPRVFEIFMKEYDDPSTVATFFYADHPQLKNRINYLSKAIEDRHYETAAFDSSYTDTTYLENTQFLWYKMPGLWISSRKYKKAVDECIALLSFDSTDASAHYWLAKSILEDDVANDSLEVAQNELYKSLEYDSLYVDSYRELGNYFNITNDTSNAIYYYQKYLYLADKPKDRRYISNIIKTLGTGNE